MSDIDILALALCDEENQPHQWMGDPELLKGAIASSFSCSEPAEWELAEEDVYGQTYSCTRHLSQMVADDTISILPYDGFDLKHRCCFISDSMPTKKTEQETITMIYQYLQKLSEYDLDGADPLADCTLRQRIIELMDMLKPELGGRDDGASKNTD